jgi:hypothetical protein
MFSIGRVNDILMISMIGAYAVISGFISVKIIDKITHKEKREILAGSLIALPTTISIMLYTLILNNLRFIETIDPVIASVVFFVCFNIPFLVIVYEHEKHKHHLIGFVIAPLILATVYLFAYFFTIYMAADNIKPQIIDSFTIAYEVAPLKNYVENCMRTVGEEAVMENVDLKEYIDSNLVSCIRSFEAFSSVIREDGRPSSSVSYGENSIVIKLEYPLSFTEKNINYRISEFQTIIER